MPVSKHRKRSKQNSFGLRKEQKRREEEYRRHKASRLNRLSESQALRVYSTGGKYDEV